MAFTAMETRTDALGAYGAILASGRLALRSIFVWYRSMYDLEKQAAS